MVVKIDRNKLSDFILNYCRYIYNKVVDVDNDSGTTFSGRGNDLTKLLCENMCYIYNMLDGRNSDKRDVGVFCACDVVHTFHWIDVCFFEDCKRDFYKHSEREYCIALLNIKNEVSEFLFGRKYGYHGYNASSYPIISRLVRRFRGGCFDNVEFLKDVGGFKVLNRKKDEPKEEIDIRDFSFWDFVKDILIAPFKISWNFVRVLICSVIFSMLFYSCCNAAQFMFLPSTKITVFCLAFFYSIFVHFFVYLMKD